MDLVRKTVKPARTSVTRERLRQRPRARHGDGRSTNTSFHTPGGGARGGGGRSDLARIDAISRKTPTLARCRRRRHTTWRMWPAGGGGIPAILSSCSRCRPHETGLLTVTGKTLEENVAGRRAKDPGGHPAPVRRVQHGRRGRGPLRQPRDRRSGRQDGGVDPRECWVFRGVAVISESAGPKAFGGDPQGHGEGGRFVVIRYEGAQGRNRGCRRCSRRTSYIMGEGASATGWRWFQPTGPLFRRDARRHHRHVSPKAPAGGTMRPWSGTGDRIRLDIPAAGSWSWWCRESGTGANGRAEMAAPAEGETGRLPRKVPAMATSAAPAGSSRGETAG